MVVDRGFQDGGEQKDRFKDLFGWEKAPASAKVVEQSAKKFYKKESSNALRIIPRAQYSPSFILRKKSEKELKRGPHNLERGKAQEKSNRLKKRTKKTGTVGENKTGNITSKKE